MLGFVSAWAGHTDASREMAQDIARAFELADLKHDAAAQLMGLTAQQLSRQLAGCEPFNLWRLGFLPIAFHTAWIERRSARIGAALINANHGDGVI